MEELRPKKVPRKKILEWFGISKVRLIQLEKKHGFTKFYFDESRRKPYYDLKEIEDALKPGK
jgi:hypothetical protein